MGCINSKDENVKEKKANGTKDTGGPAGQQFSSIEQGHNDALGMSQRQVFSLKQSWKGIKRRMEETGVDMFVGLFRSNKDIQKMFSKFKDITSDNELRASEELEQHAMLVMNVLDEAITHIDNYDYIQNILVPAGKVHLKIPGFRPETFYAMKEPFLDAVKATLGDRYTDNIQSIYGIAITFILQTMVDSIKDGHRAIMASKSNGSV